MGIRVGERVSVRRAGPRAWSRRPWWCRRAALVRYALAVRDARKQVAGSLDPVEVPDSGCGLGRAQPDHPGVGEAVEIPGGRPGARGAVRCGERAAFSLSGPPQLPVERGHLLKGRWLGSPGRLSFQGQVHPRELDGESACGVRLQVPCLAGAWTAGEVQVAVMPDDTDARRVRAAIG